MAQTAYWIAHATASWPGTPTGAQIAAGNLSSGSPASYSGSETGFATSGTVTIDEATAITGLAAGTSYTTAWTVYDDVALTYATPTVGTVTTATDITINATVGNAVAAGVAGMAGVGVDIAATPGNAVAAGATGLAGVAVEIAAAPGNAVAAGVTGLVELVASTLIDGVVGNAAAAGVTGTVTAAEAVAFVGGGGFAWGAPRKTSRYAYLGRPTREQMAERVRKQREALGILPKSAQKRIAAAVKKEARRAEPSLAPLAPVAVEVAQHTGAPLQAVIDAIRAAFEHQRLLLEARMQADAAMRAEAQQRADEQARIEAQAAEQARQQRLVVLRAEDDDLLRRTGEARQAAIATIRQVQKALVALMQ